MNKTAEEAADRAIGKLFLTLGVDLSDPKAVIAFQDDLRFLSHWRESTQAVKRKALLTAVGVIITGAIGYLLLAFRGHQ
ncbi:MAG: hypothetical protein K8F62_10665 [Pseudorhodoplanes sp.]|nr:hypothetical protein [Pseudorhodoplanes sp.]